MEGAVDKADAMLTLSSAL